MNTYIRVNDYGDFWLDTPSTYTRMTMNEAKALRDQLTAAIAELEDQEQDL